ncbi:MAG: hypothetical protein ACOYON_08795 [Fimbriimonas sp.]
MSYLAATGLAGVLGTLSQDVRLDNPFGAPELAAAFNASAQTIPPRPADKAVTAETTTRQEKLVSVSFNSAPVSEVVAWMTKQGVSYVIVSTAYPKDATITLNIQDQPLREVADAVAVALGGRWERSGNILVFKKGQDGVFFSRVQPLEGLEGLGQMPGLDPKEMAELQKALGDIKIHLGPLAQEKMQLDALSGRDGGGLTKAQRAEMDRELAKARKEIDQARKEMEKALRDGGPGSKQMQEEMARAFRDRGQEGGGMTRAQRAEMDRALADARKQMDEAHREMEKAFKEDGPESKRMREEMDRAFKDMERTHQEEGKFEFRGLGAEGAPARPPISIRVPEFRSFAGSLTPSQKAKHKKQGYLKLSDLTPAQRKKLGVTGSGKFEIRFNENGTQLVIKS